MTSQSADKNRHLTRRHISVDVKIRSQRYKELISHLIQNVAVIKSEPLLRVLSFVGASGDPTFLLWINLNIHMNVITVLLENHNRFLPSVATLPFCSMLHQKQTPWKGSPVQIILKLQLLCFSVVKT